MAVWAMSVSIRKETKSREAPATRLTPTPSVPEAVSLRPIPGSPPRIQNEDHRESFMRDLSLL